MLKTIIKFAYEQEGRNTWEQMAHDTAQNLHIARDKQLLHTLNIARLKLLPSVTTKVMRNFQK